MRPYRKIALGGITEGEIKSKVVRMSLNGTKQNVVLLFRPLLRYWRDC